MIWTRRAFLQTVLAGVAVAVAAPAIQLSAFVAPAVPVFDPGHRFDVFDVIARPREGSSATLHTLELSRHGHPVLNTYIPQSGTYRWVAMPGWEIPSDGLQNTSSCDLDVMLCVRQDGHRFSIDQLGAVTSMETPCDASREAIA